MANQDIISTAAVIGAGSMGSGIAAHLANAGVRVHLLDVPADGEDRDARAKAGIERQLTQLGFMDPDFAARVRPGNIADHLDRLGEAEWIVEAVFEDLDVKHETFARIAAHRAPGTPVSSNTSTIPLEKLVEGMDPDLAENFAVIHFFNPPRVMRLVELVAGPETSAQTVEHLRAICERQLGKVVVDCRDTPGFIANRVGNLWMAAGAAIALERGVRPGLADAVFGKPFGVPRTGVFGLFDYVGLQLVPAIWGSLLGALPDTDAYHRFDITAREEFTTLLDRGLTGRSGESGFYRGRKEVFDFDRGDYRQLHRPDPEADAAVGEKTARGVLACDTEAGRYAREVFLTTLAYCCEVADEIAETVEHIDVAMQLGYNWKRGPFALADAIGLDFLAGLYRDTEGFGTVPGLLVEARVADGFYPDGPAGSRVLSGTGEVVARRKRAGVVTVAGLRGAAETVIDNGAAAVHRLRDGAAAGVGVLQIATPMNSCSPEVLEVFAEAAARKDLKALVIADDDERVFSAGADLPTLARLAEAGDRDGLAGLMRQGVEALEALRRAPFPVVGAVRGVALGGGLELALHCDALAVHAEARPGFPERQVGLFPGWGGTARTLERAIDSGAVEPHRAAFDFIMGAKKVPGAYPARRLGLVRETDRIVMSVDHVIAEALELAVGLAEGYTEPGVRELPLYPADAPALEFTEGSATDAAIGQALARVYTARPGDGTGLPADELTRRETEQATDVLVRPDNAARAEHMATTRKPLKN